jgi:hypothetical protein
VDNLAAEFVQGTNASHGFRPFDRVDAGAIERGIDAFLD